MCRIPRMARQDVLIDPIAQMFARQTVMLNIVDQLQLPNSDKSLKSKEQRPGKTADTKSQEHKANLQCNISQQRILRMEKPAPGPAQHGPLCGYGRKKALSQHPGKEMVKTLIIACCDRILRGSDIPMMHQQMLAAKMRIQHHRQKPIRHPALMRSFLMHQLMAIIDTNRARHHAQTEK